MRGMTWHRCLRFVSSRFTAELFLELGDALLGCRRVLLLTGQLRLGGCQFPGEPLSISCRPLTDGPVIAVRGPYSLTAHYAATLSALWAVDDAGGNAAVLAMLNVGHHMVATESEVPSIEVFLALLPRRPGREQAGELLYLLRPHRRWRATKTAVRHPRTADGPPSIPAVGVPLAEPLVGFLVFALLGLGQPHERWPAPQLIRHGLSATATGLIGHVLPQLRHVPSRFQRASRSRRRRSSASAFRAERRARLAARRRFCSSVSLAMASPFAAPCSRAQPWNACWRGHPVSRLPVCRMTTCDRTWIASGLQATGVVWSGQPELPDLIRGQEPHCREHGQQGIRRKGQSCQPATCPEPVLAGRL